MTILFMVGVSRGWKFIVMRGTFHISRCLFSQLVPVADGLVEHLRAAHKMRLFIMLSRLWIHPGCRRERPQNSLSTQCEYGRLEAAPELLIELYLWIEDDRINALRSFCPLWPKIRERKFTHDVSEVPPSKVFSSDKNRFQVSDQQNRCWTEDKLCNRHSSLRAQNWIYYVWFFAPLSWILHDSFWGTFSCFCCLYDSFVRLPSAAFPPHYLHWQVDLTSSWALTKSDWFS